MILGSGEGVPRACYPASWVGYWIDVLLGPLKVRLTRYEAIHKCVSGDWYQGNLILTLPQEDKDYLLAHLPERGNP